jgi:competence protein ComEC
VSDRGIVALAAMVVVGALVAHPVSLVLAVGGVVVALAWRRPLLLCASAALLASGLAARAWDGVAPTEARFHEGRVTLLTDPVEVGGAVRAQVRAGDDRLDAWFRGPPAGRVRGLLAGEGVDLRGRVTPRPDAGGHLAIRHVVGRLSVSAVTDTDRGDPASRLANRVRRALEEGAVGLDDQPRALLLGVLLGDDRRQSAVVADDFQAAGLGHLLAVSGQNVAFLLIAVGPLLHRLGGRTRFALTVAVLAGFALLTRFEPSVLRATAMAAVAATGVALGRPAEAVRTLALAVTALVLVDPLLVHSLGFRLSVAATAAILALGAPIARVIPGPEVLGEAVGVTVAAQIGVAPLLLPAFGGLPVAALPANVLAAPAVAPLTVWGMTAGIVAGVAGPPWANWLHGPSGVLTGWLLHVARVATTLGLGDLGWAHLAALGSGSALAAGATRVGRTDLRRVVRGAGLAVVAAALLAPAVALRLAAPPAGPVADGVDAWGREHAVVLVAPGARPEDALAGLRRQGVRSVTLLAVRTADAATLAVATDLVERYDPPVVWTPGGVGVAGADAPSGAASWRVGTATLTVDPAADRLDIHVVSAG